MNAVFMWATACLFFMLLLFFGRAIYSLLSCPLILFKRAWEINRVGVLYVIKIFQIVITTNFQLNTVYDNARKRCSPRLP
jgi:hypothetical protein